MPEGPPPSQCPLARHWSSRVRSLVSSSLDDVLIVRASDCERPIDAKVERAPHNVMHLIHDLDSANYERARLLRQG